MKQLRDILRGQVGDYVAEFIHFQRDAFHQAVAHSLGLGRDEAGKVRDRVAELVQLDALAEPANHRRKNIPRVEGVRDGIQEVVIGGDVPHLDVFLALVDEREHAVIRRDKCVFHRASQDRPPRRAHARVHHHQVNRVGGEEPVALDQREGGFEHVVRADVVVEVHQDGFGIDIQYDGFDDPDEMVLKPEVGGEGYESFARQKFPRRARKIGMMNRTASYRKGEPLSRRVWHVDSSFRGNDHAGVRHALSPRASSAEFLNCTGRGATGAGKWVKMPAHASAVRGDFGGRLP